MDRVEAKGHGRRQGQPGRSVVSGRRSWDGSHSALKRHVKKSLLDPGSFEHMETGIWPVSKDGTHRLRMKFRARNGFGGMAVVTVLAEIENDDCDFTVLEMLSL